MKKWILSISLAIVGLLFLVVGIYIGEVDDSPGAGGLGIILMLCFCWLGWKVLRKF